MKKAETEARLASMERALKRKNRRINKLYALVAFLAVLLIAGGAYGGFKYNKLQDENTRLSNPQESARAEEERVKSQVEKLVDTPKDESPTIATVTDVEKLKSQPFFADAQNGDKVLIYKKANRAILYRPSTNKIINTTNNVDDNTSSQDTSSGADKASETPNPATDPENGQSQDDGTTTNP